MLRKGNEIMSRCHHCGLFLELDQENGDNGCVWYNMPIHDRYENLKCENFMKKVPGWNVRDHLDWKIKQSDLRQKYVTARLSFYIAVASIIIAGASLTLAILK